MKSERQLSKRIADAQAAYEKAVATQPAAKAQPLADKVKRLKAELMALITEGAKVCPNCKAAPVGLKRKPGLYEVGCINCPNTRARGETAEEAVENWNAGPKSWVQPVGER